MGERPVDPVAMTAGYRRLWGIDDGPRRGQRPRLDIRQVLQAGVELADADGLDAVSMSRVATELGVTTMALYRYVESKEELLELMIEAAAGDPPPLGDELDWRAALRTWARNLSALYRDHPWVTTVPFAGPPRGPHQLAWLEQGLHAQRGTGLAEFERLAIVMVLLSHVRGEATLEQQMIAASPSSDASPPSSGGASEDRRYATLLRSVVTPDRFPQLTAVLTAGLWDGDVDARATGATVGAAPGDTGTDLGAFGLEVILDGVELLVRRRGSAEDRA